MLQLMLMLQLEQGHNMKTVIIGDFNLNEDLKFSNEYSHKSYYDELNQVFDPHGLVQLVDFTTWRRLVNGVWRTSIIDHVYTNDETCIYNLAPVDTVVGDHCLITMSINIVNKHSPSISFRRDWSEYTKDKIVHALSAYNLNWEIPDVQCFWNKLEEILIGCTDDLAPMTEYLDNVSSKSQITPIISNRMTILNNKINLDWLNLSLTSFKLKIKSQFLMN